jgi:hypothetical protein
VSADKVVLDDDPGRLVGQEGVVEFAAAIERVRQLERFDRSKLAAELHLRPIQINRWLAIMEDRRIIEADGREFVYVQVEPGSPARERRAPPENATAPAGSQAEASAARPSRASCTTAGAAPARSTKSVSGNRHPGRTQGPGKKKKWPPRGGLTAGRRGAFCAGAGSTPVSGIHGSPGCRLAARTPPYASGEMRVRALPPCPRPVV